MGHLLLPSPAFELFCLQFRAYPAPAFHSVLVCTVSEQLKRDFLSQTPSSLGENRRHTLCAASQGHAVRVARCNLFWNAEALKGTKILIVDFVSICAYLYF